MPDGFKYEPDMGNLITFMAIAMCSGASQSYGYVNTNQLADTLNAKYGWNDPES